MIPSARRVLAAAACSAMLLASCATPRGAAAPAPQTVLLEEWPRPAAAPRFKFVSSLTEARVRGGPRAWWRTLVWLLTGSPDAATDSGTLVRPFDVEPDAEGGYVVADPDLAAVFRYGPDGRVKGLLECSGAPWVAPMSLATGPDGTFFVADAGAGTVVRWTPEACTALRSTDLSRPTGVAFAGGRVFVADPPSHRILVFTADGSPGESVGALGEGVGQFNYPTDVAAAPDGTIFVIDALNFRVVHLANDGRWLGAFGAPGDEDGALARPKGVHVDRHGHVWVTDAQRDVVLLFSGDGTFVAAYGGTGELPGRFAHPSGISSVGSMLIVADSQNRRVQLFDARGELP